MNKQSTEIVHDVNVMTEIAEVQRFWHNLKITLQKQVNNSETGTDWNITSNTG